MLRLLLLAALTLSLSACSSDGDVATAPDEDVAPAPDGAPELPDPDPDTPLDVDPLSRQDGQSSDEAALDSAETGQEVLDRPMERLEGTNETDGM